MAVGRFQVMAVLQAARAHLLGLELASAKSWGLNRAIFYAAAKRGFKGAKPVKRSRSEVKGKPVQETPEAYHLGSEVAFKAPQQEDLLYFTIGGKVQTREEFQRQIEARFGPTFEQAWEEALKYVRSFEDSTLLSQSAFFNSVYKPRRDEFATKWSEQKKK
ncbi:MAG: hypothetical protein ACXADB_00670 [Candidatus Hermodarchaeia archaeon]|jgi:hypothetical protein